MKKGRTQHRFTMSATEIFSANYPSIFALESNAGANPFGGKKEINRIQLHRFNTEKHIQDIAFIQGTHHIPFKGIVIVFVYKRGTCMQE